MNPLLKLIDHGQAYWLDDLTRKMITGGDVARRIEEEGLRGITSNPNIFSKAIANSSDYDAQIEHGVARGLSTQEIYEELITTDVRSACDVLRGVYDASNGQDGYVSLEVSPHLAHDTDGSLGEARRLWQAVDRPNLFIKIPGTPEGLPVIEELLFEGLNINITLLFSVRRYEAVAEAYVRALERRAQAGKPVDGVASVASFFLSRIDVLVDRLLDHRTRPAGHSGSGPQPERLKGRAAVANAKLAYQRFKALLEGERWRGLAERGARVQRLLWASTSTKNPDYDSVMYVEPLIGPHTVNTMPESTIRAFARRGRVATTVEDGVDEAHGVMEQLGRVGINFDLVTQQLENEGIQKFIDPYDELMASLAHECQRFSNRRHVAPLERTARRLRRQVVQMTTAAGSGHPTSSLSAADLMCALFFRAMRWDPGDPHANDVDRFVLSKGHAAPILWAVLHEAGAIEEDLMTLRRIDSTLEGHPTPRNPWVKVATGSLGQGLAAANGMALANSLDGIDARIYCLLGDGECSEGSVWEAAQFASLNGLAGVVAMVDVNALGQSGPAPYGHRTRVLAERFRAFGWRVLEIDGHDMGAILDALDAAKEAGPSAIIARTVKGKGVSFLEGARGWHGKTLDRQQMEAALAELPEVDPGLAVEPRRVGAYSPPAGGERPQPITVSYEHGAEVATRDGYGNALRKLGEVRPDIVVLDGDVKNSTRTEAFAEAHPGRFFEGYIAEQNLAGAALGLAAAGKIPYVTTFGCFLTRAHDFIRMAAHSRPPHLVFCGSHAGVSIGEDGPSQMALEDLGMFRALADSTVLYPGDAVAAERLTEAAADLEGIVYIRTNRPKTPILYDGADTFPVGGSKVLRQGPDDRVTVVAAGVTLHEALAAHDTLRGHGVGVRVIDAYSVKPLDVETLTAAARETEAVVVVEDHRPEGGLGEAVAVALAGRARVHCLAVRGEPRSGTGAELLDRHGISRRAIVGEVLQLVGD